MQRSGQQWILDNLLRTLGNDVLFPGVDAFRVERGYKLADLQRTFGRIKSFRDSSKQWEKTAERQESIAREAEDSQHLVTATEAYFRAALYYTRAQWSIFDTNDRKRSLMERCAQAYDKVIKYHTGHIIERVEIPLGHTTIAGLLHLPRETDGPVPCVLFTPGMDMTKEDYPDVNNPGLVRRGMAVLTIDGPGQGVSHLRDLKVNLTNYEEAGAACLTYLAGRPEIDSERIAVFGVSMGSYWAPRIAAYDSRVAACVGALGVFMQKDTIFNQAQPTFKRRYMYMAGLEDEQEFDTMAGQMTMAGRGSQIQCPTLLVTGELDELCPVEDAHALYAELNTPKELWVFEGEFHPLGGVIADALPAIYDWLNDALMGRLPNDHARVEMVPEP